MCTDARSTSKYLFSPNSTRRWTTFLCILNQYYWYTSEQHAVGLHTLANSLTYSTMRRWQQKTNKQMNAKYKRTRKSYSLKLASTATKWYNTHLLGHPQSRFEMSTKFLNWLNCWLLSIFLQLSQGGLSIFPSHVFVPFSLSFLSVFSFFSTFFSFSSFLFFPIWVWRRCGWLRGFVDFITRIFSGMKLNANTEQIEGKLYFNIRENFSLKLGWGWSLMKHVYTIITLLFNAFQPFFVFKARTQSVL